MKTAHLRGDAPIKTLSRRVLSPFNKPSRLQDLGLILLSLFLSGHIMSETSDAEHTLLWLLSIY